MRVFFPGEKNESVLEILLQEGSQFPRIFNQIKMWVESSPKSLETEDGKNDGIN